MKKIAMMFSFIMFFVVIGGYKEAYANGKMPFQVTPILSTLQENGTIGYFEINAKPNETIKQQFMIENKTNAPIKVYIEPVVAISNANGTISYVPEKDAVGVKEDKHYLHKNINVIREITLKPKEQKVVAFYLNTPSSNTGIYLAGLTFNQELEPTKVNENNKEVNFIVNNELQYVVAVQLNMEKKEQEKVRYAEEIEVVQGSKIELFLPVFNENRTIYKQELLYKLSKKNGEEVGEGVFNIKMAPRTNAKYLLPWIGQVEEGEYVLEIFSKDQLTGLIKKYEFTIKGKEVEKIVNEGDITQKQVILTDNIPIWVYGLLTFFMFLVIILIIVIVKIKKKDEQKKGDE